MKKSLLVIAVAALAMTSCTKEYTCVCTTKDNGTVVSTVEVTFEAKKKDAESACSGKASASIAGSTISQECKLK